MGFVSSAPSDVVKVHESPIALQSKMATFLPLPTQSSQSPPSHPWDADKAYDAAPRACTGERRVSHQSVYDRAGICVPNRSLVSMLIAAASQLCKRCVFCSDLKIFTKDAISCGLMGLRIT